MTTALAMQFHIDQGYADLVLGQTLVTDDWLWVVIFTTLFTDRRASVDELPAGEDDPRGYWGDVFFSAPAGSLLWTLRRELLSTATLLRARDICLTALRPLLKTHAKKIDVITEKIAKDRASVRVLVTRMDGSLLNPVYGEFLANAA